MGQKDLINQYLINLQKNERVFRINAGMGWTGKVTHKGKFVIIENPYPLHAAPTGWPDLCGWETIKITPDMVGQKIAVFKGVEVKATGKLSDDQERFRDLILKMGGKFVTLNLF